MEPTSEQELKQLLDEGKITEEEYKELQGAIQKGSQAASFSSGQKNTVSRFSFCSVPWQLWVIIILFAITAFGDFSVMLDKPLSMFWFVFKIFIIIGFIKRWKWTFVLFQIVTGVSVVLAALSSLGIALVNVGLMILAWNARCYFFDRQSKTQFSEA